ncbi:MAG: asparagine synthetase B family protein [Oscillospiraceae bacterium]
MCAIAGILGSTGETGRSWRGMLETMTRRGPDQWGIFQKKGLSSPPCPVGCRRGLAGKLQPMDLLFRGIHYHMVYNGELYNTEDLRRLLVLDGHTFLGHSDTEVVLHAYAQWGDSCVERFNGIFAFAVWEEEPERLFLARDRIGVKPLFTPSGTDNFYSPQELKTLLAHPSVPQVDAQGVAEVMLLGPGPDPGCGVFRGIREVEPGCCGYFDGQDMRLHRYWRLEDREHQDTLPQTLERVRALVSDAIRRQLVSDVPICTFLSGGLDSSLISSVAACGRTRQGRKLHTFSVDYKDNAKYFRRRKIQPVTAIRNSSRS